MTSDADFVREFEARRWPLEQWHHRDHVRLAYLYLRQGTFEQAADRLRAGLKAYIAAHGIVDTPTQGYHETLTLAWLRLVEMILAEYGPEESGEAFCDAHPELSQTKTLRLFYSKDLLTSPRAKFTFLAPDLAPLPTARGAERGERPPSGGSLPAR